MGTAASGPVNIGGSPGHQFFDASTARRDVSIEESILVGTPIAARDGQNFFELGRRSLLVLQMMGRIRRVFELEVPVRSVFDEPTIEG